MINNDNANKTQNYQNKTRYGNIKLNELNNKTINTVIKTENYYADNQNRNVRQLENRTQ